MANTNPTDFKKFLGCLTDEQKSKVWFIPIRSNSKIPDVKTSFKENKNCRLTIYDAYQRLKNGSNVGICATTDSLMFLDIDVQNKKLIASQDILDRLELIMTCKIQSRNGGYQYYFQNDGKYANQLVHEGKTVIGELRTDWWYVVSVGSYVDTDDNNCNGDGTYRFLSGSKIQKFPGGLFNFESVAPETKKTSHIGTGIKFSNEEYQTMMKSRRRFK